MKQLALQTEAAVRQSEEDAVRLDDAPPQQTLQWAVETHRPSLALACSFGMQSVVMIDMLHQLGLLDGVEVFYLDTGVLFDETHLTRIRVQERYGFQAVRVEPQLTWTGQQIKYDGDLYRRGPEGINECCRIRKVEPLRRHLADKTAWITGMRRSHGNTRQKLPVVLWDQVNQLVKINPLAGFETQTLWGYIKANDVPYNPLYDQGYKSIGCNTPICTRPVGPHEDERAGRWVGLAKTECGIHVDGRVVTSLDSSKL